jgi:DNA-binding MarR family transcriptional regulator
MSHDPLPPVEQGVLHIAHRHIDYPIELAMVLRLVKQFGWHMSCSADALLKTWGITYVEYSLLTALYGHQGRVMSVAELSEAIGEAPEQIKRLTLALGGRGLVARNRDAADRRKVVTTLSKDGVVLVQNMLPVINGMTADYVDSFAPGELANLLTLLRKLMDGARWREGSG